MEIKLRLEAKDRQGVLHDPEAGKQLDREVKQAQHLVRGGIMVHLCLASHSTLLYFLKYYFIVALFSFYYYYFPFYYIYLKIPSSG